MLKARIARLERIRAAIRPAAGGIVFLPKDEMAVSVLQWIGATLQAGVPPDHARPRIVATGDEQLKLEQIREGLPKIMAYVANLKTAGQLETVEDRLVARGHKRVPRANWHFLIDSPLQWT